MSVRQFAPQLTEHLDFSAISPYLIKYSVISKEESTNYFSQLCNGSSTNAVVMNKVLHKIEQHPRHFYRALRESVNDHNQNCHLGNKFVFSLLPKHFVSS